MCRDPQAVLIADSYGYGTVFVKAWQLVVFDMQACYFFYAVTMPNTIGRDANTNHLVLARVEFLHDLASR